MTSLFKVKYNPSGGKVIDPNMNYNRYVYRGLIDDVKAYYKKHPKHIDAKNLIARLIYHFQLHFELDDYRYVTRIESQLDSVLRSFGITTISNRGKIHTGGILLGQDTEEIIISDTNRIDTTNLNTKWQSLEPLQYLYHTRTDVNLPIMNNTTAGKGYGVLKINVPMLMLQYRYWVRSVNANYDQQETIHRFIGRYPIVNLINSYLDIAYFNRLARQSYKLPKTKYPTAHPFYLTDMTDRLDRTAEMTNDKNSLYLNDIESLAYRIPLIINEDLKQLLVNANGAITLQNEWAYWVAFAPYYKYLVNVLKSNQRFDHGDLFELKLEIKEAKSSNVFAGFTNTPVIKQTLEILDWIYQA